MKRILLTKIMLLFIISNTTLAQDKSVYWIHGNNDNENAWKHYADIFDSE